MYESEEIKKIEVGKTYTGEQLGFYVSDNGAILTCDVAINDSNSDNYKVESIMKNTYIISGINRCKQYCKEIDIIQLKRV